MKVRKFNESLNEDEPKIGDYIIIKYDSIVGNAYNFITNNIGKFIKYNSNRTFPYQIEFFNIPNDIESYFNNNCRNYKYEEILYWSNNKEELELLIQSNKFNI